MENEHKTHGISICERRAAVLTGILSVEGFDEENVLMKTAEEEGLSIQGHGLHVDKFDSDTGELAVSGLVDAVVYYDIKRKRGGRFSQRRGQ